MNYKNRCGKFSVEYTPHPHGPGYTHAGKIVVDADTIGPDAFDTHIPISVEDAQDLHHLLSQMLERYRVSPVKP